MKTSLRAAVSLDRRLIAGAHATREMNRARSRCGTFECLLASVRDLRDIRARVRLRASATALQTMSPRVRATPAVSRAAALPAPLLLKRIRAWAAECRIYLRQNEQPRGS